MFDFEKIGISASLVRAGVSVKDAAEFVKGNITKEQANDIAALVNAGLTVDEIKQYAEVIETAPELPKDAALEDVKAAAEIKAVDELPKASEPEDADPIAQLRDLVK
jgi:hypothetical protein